MKFAGNTSIALGEPTVGEKKLTFGVSSMLLSDNFLGIEGDVEQTPQFFGPGFNRTVSGSAVTTLTGNVSNLLGLDIGGGVIGFVSPRAGARFELRHFKNLTDDASGAVTIGGTKLSFWRVTAGLVLRY
jgi:hypothetical protein